MRSLEFDFAAFKDLAQWIQQDRRKALRIVNLIRDVQRDLFIGIGEAEPLKHKLKGCWSRRIDQEHRLVIKLPKIRSGFSLVNIITEVLPPGIALLRNTHSDRERTQQ